MKRPLATAFSALLALAIAWGMGGCGTTAQEAETDVGPAAEAQLQDLEPDDASQQEADTNSDDAAQPDDAAESGAASAPVSIERRIGDFLDPFIDSPLAETPYRPETEGYITERVVEWAYQQVCWSDEQLLVKADTQIEGSTAGYLEPPQEDGSRSSVYGGTWYTSSIETAALEEAISRMLGFDLVLDDYHEAPFWESQGRMYSVGSVRSDHYVHFVHVTGREDLGNGRQKVDFTRFKCFVDEGSVNDAWYQLDDDEIEAAMKEELEGSTHASKGTAVVQLHDDEEGSITLVSLVMNGTTDRIEDMTMDSYLGLTDTSAGDERWSGVAEVGDTITTDTFVVELPSTWTDEVEWSITHGSKGYESISVYLKGMDSSQPLISIYQTEPNAIEELGDISSYSVTIVGTDQVRGVCREYNWAFYAKSYLGRDDATEEDRAHCEAIMRLMTAGTVALDDVLGQRDRIHFLENDFARWWFGRHVEIKEPPTTVVTVR